MKTAKKSIATSLLTLVLLLTLTACGTDKDNTVRIGATPTPHVELLELVKADLAAEGIDLEIVPFTDYVKPNLALAEGELDLNFFQHQPYLDAFNAEHDLTLTSLFTVHVEPMALYGGARSSLDDLSEGDVIAIPADAVNGGRALLLLEAEGLIEVDPAAGLEATERDIVENPKGLRFKAIEAAQLPRVLEDVAGAVINGNYAIGAGLNPLEDALLIEGSDSPYANVVVADEGAVSTEVVEKVRATLQSETLRTYIETTYEGAVVPAF
jgi:D-methionine transport system substrate-binding protein